MVTLFSINYYPGLMSHRRLIFLLSDVTGKFQGLVLSQEEMH